VVVSQAARLGPRSSSSSSNRSCGIGSRPDAGTLSPCLGEDTPGAENEGAEIEAESAAVEAEARALLRSEISPVSFAWAAKASERNTGSDIKRRIRYSSATILRLPGRSRHEWRRSARATRRPADVCEYRHELCDFRHVYAGISPLSDHSSALPAATLALF